MSGWERAAAFLSRILLAQIFIVAGLGKISGFAETQAYMAKYGIPATALFAAATIAVELLGGLSLLLGYKAKLGAGLLFLFLIPVTLIFHTEFSNPLQRIQFMKNLAIMGGLLVIAAWGPGPFSLDHRRGR